MPGQIGLQATVSLSLRFACSRSRLSGALVGFPFCAEAAHRAASVTLRLSRVGRVRATAAVGSAPALERAVAAAVGPRTGMVTSGARQGGEGRRGFLAIRRSENRSNQERSERVPSRLLASGLPHRGSMSARFKIELRLALKESRIRRGPSREG